MTVLSALLALYAMAGFFLAMRFAGSRDPRFRWELLVAGGVAFAVSAGTAALVAWRMERRAPAWLVVCGVLGAAMCVLLPASAPADVVTPAMWRAASLGGALFLAFMLLAAAYVRALVRGVAGRPR